MKNLMLMLLILSVSLVYAEGWTQVPAKGDVPPALYGHTMTQLGDVYYLFGGMDAVAALDGRAAPRTELYQFTPSTNTFAKVTPKLASGSDPLPGMTEHNAVVQDGKMYVFNGRRSEANSCTYVFDPKANTWEQQKATLPFEPRAEAAVATLNGEMYMVGGRINSTSAVTDECWKYKFATGTWERRTSLPWGGVAGASAMIYTNASSQNMLYVYGGTNAQGEQNTLWEQNVSYNAWMMATQYGTIPPPRAYHLGIPNNNELWVSGGFGASGALATNVLGDDGSTQLGDTYKLTLNGTQGPTWETVKAGPEHWKSAGYLVVDGKDRDLCFLGGIKDNQPIPLSTIYQYSTNDDPPPVKNMESQIGALGRGRFSVYFLAFDKDQAKLTVNISWAQTNANLRLCALYVPCMIRADHPMAQMSGLEESPEMFSEHHLMALQRSKEFVESQRGSPITKTFTNLKRGTLILLILHKFDTKPAKNIKVAFSDYTTLPKNVTFLFPVGNPDSTATTAGITSYMKFPATPVKWYARLPLPRTMKEVVTPGAVWTWSCIDTTPRMFLIPAYVKFALP